MMRSAAVAAKIAGVQPATLRQWVKRGHIPPPVDGLYDMAMIIEYCAHRDQHDFRRALAGRVRRGERRVSLRE